MKVDQVPGIDFSKCFRVAIIGPLRTASTFWIVASPDKNTILTHAASA
jgi:hypothetical protein